MGTEIYKTLLEDLNKGEEVALITKYNLETKKVEKNIYNLEELEGKNLEYVNKAKEKNLIANIKINDEESVLAEVLKGSIGLLYLEQDMLDIIYVILHQK